MKKNWKGFQPPGQGSFKSPLGKPPTKDSPIGGYKLGRKSRSRKVKQVIG